MRPGRRRKPDLSDRVDAISDRIERLKAGVRATIEHPFRVLKRQFSYTKTRYRGLKKNTARSRHCLRWAICGWRARLYRMCITTQLHGIYQACPRALSFRPGSGRLEFSSAVFPIRSQCCPA